MTQPFDPIKKAGYYNSHPSGVETKEVTFYLSGFLAASVKYVWRAGKKGSVLEDLRKAAWCFEDEAARLQRDGNGFSISDKWVEPAKRVVWHEFDRPMTVSEELLKGVLGSLLLSGMRYREGPPSDHVLVRQCAAEVEHVIHKLAPALEATDHPEFGKASIE